MKLSSEAQKIFDGIQKEYDIQDEAGILLLQSAMESWDMCRNAEKEIEKYGLVIEDKYTKVKANPACTVLKEHKTLMLNYLKALNLDFSTIEQNNKIPSGLLR